MSDIRYSLEKYKGRSTRCHCPKYHQRTFTRYADNYINKYLSEYSGRCNRVEKCAYHFTPKMYFEKNGYEPVDFHIPALKRKTIIKSPSCIDKKLMLASLTNYHQNNFAIGLSKYFPEHLVVEVLQRYYVGTAKGNKTIFWQVNRLGQVRTGKVMQYNSATLKRVRYINWVHHITKQKDFNLKQVFFGAHLLIDKTRPVAISEGEKNAIFGALYYPQYNWIAVGSIEMLNVQKLNALRGYKVTLFPDKGKAFEKWIKIAESTCLDVHVNTVLENTDLNEGDDIADLIISVKKEQYKARPDALIDNFKKKNEYISLLIDRLDLKVLIH
ncbi:DUF6371 domain-containing protein [Carboxylicivirga sp. M1479]|uniref:DUF6371 domain-containing protein n=1 Tax=Carboxylicivirga sp. M1479 TaxID=2594476 RepID=UPI0011782BDB|nr:DUF6371 domain-containing protein [Carboxylicivirga sp. M1479]TRX70341.1 hypothetical protein FNN09_12740 [Carboxylicivirga sp. M1479]